MVLPFGQMLALQLGGLALFVSLAVTGFAARGGLGDIPDYRSSHARTTPTAGGLGIVAGVGAAMLLAATLYADPLFAQPGSAQRLASLLSLTFAIAMLGLIDDRMVVPTWLKFGLILLICLAGAQLIGPIDMLPFGRDHIYLLWWSALGGTALWLFVTVNAVNFMDGINGLMASSMGIASAGLFYVAIQSGAPVTALVSGTLAMACLGFLPYNFRRRAAVFSGDCGALATAFLYGGAVLLLISEQPELRLLYVGTLLILPILADVLVTLVRKPFMGIPLAAPHSQHLYQRWARASGSHLRVTVAYAGLSLLLVALVRYALARGTVGSFWGLLLLAGLFVCLYAARASTLPPPRPR